MLASPAYESPPARSHPESANYGGVGSATIPAPSGGRTSTDDSSIPSTPTEASCNCASGRLLPTMQLPLPPAPDEDSSTLTHLPGFASSPNPLSTVRHTSAVREPLPLLTAAPRPETELPRAHICWPEALGSIPLWLRRRGRGVQDTRFHRPRGAPGASATRPRRLGTLPSHPHASGPPLKLPRDRACLAVGDREPTHGCLFSTGYSPMVDRPSSTLHLRERCDGRRLTCALCGTA